jgi:hypothetical protein
MHQPRTAASILSLDFGLAADNHRSAHPLRRQRSLKVRVRNIIKIKCHNKRYINELRKARAWRIWAGNYIFLQVTLRTRPMLDRIGPQAGNFKVTIFDIMIEDDSELIERLMPT